MRTVLAISPRIVMPAGPLANTDSRTPALPTAGPMISLPDAERYRTDRRPAARSPAGDPRRAAAAPRRAAHPASVHAQQGNAERQVRSAAPAAPPGGGDAW